MKNVIWKAFKLGDLYDFDTSMQYPFTQKDLDISSEADDFYDLAVIAQSAQNNGVIGYIHKANVDAKYIHNHLMTFSLNFGICFYHDYDFALLDTHGSIFKLKAKNYRFNKVIFDEKLVNLFLSKVIDKVCAKSVYNWNWKPNSGRVAREIIMLPCIEVGPGDEYIWEENGKHYTLAVEYIKKLMEQAKELREQKTIRLYESERAKYEAERAKYEAERAKYEEGYKEEKDVLVWKGFRLGDLFTRSTKLALGKNQKDLDLIDEKNETHSIALISASREGSGRVGYIDNSLVPNELISINKLTFDDQWGFTYFQNESFVITGGHNAILEVSNVHLLHIMNDNFYLYSFISQLINKVTIGSGLFGYGYKINNKLDREIIMLPCIEVGPGDEYIWEENGKHYTLAVEYISYIYLSGRVNKNQRLIDSYSYQY